VTISGVGFTSTSSVAATTGPVTVTNTTAPIGTVRSANSYNVT
jgi:hypothetical protein